MKRGIDVSIFQREIDWTDVRSSGVEFAMIKATQGRSEQSPATYLFRDSYFVANMSNAYACGVRCGVYHYLTATTVAGAKEEAEYFLSVIAPYKKFIKLYAAVDVESKYLPCDKSLLTQIVNVFCATVKNAGFTPAVYTNPDFHKNRLNDISSWNLWLALWRNKNNIPSLEKYPNMKIWQYGSESVNGIVGDVDANYMIVDETEKKPMEEKKLDNQTAEWSEKAVKWCKENGIMIGDENGDLMLHQNVTREQMAVMLHRLYNLTIDKIVAALNKLN
jgi:GH25 family lysozyme M1 (1,4-beta-N-acetylmuramidase)